MTFDKDRFPTGKGKPDVFSIWRHKEMKMRLFCLGILFAFGLLGHAGAQETVYLIRHAEKELSGGDPALTTEGRQRAATWARVFKSAELDAVFTSDARRTQETGAPIAEELNLPITYFPKTDTSQLIDVIQFDHAEDVVLIVGHSETIPTILEGFGVLDDVAIDKSDFGSLFIVSGVSSDDPSLVRLHIP